MRRITHRPQSQCWLILLALAVFSLLGSRFMSQATGQISITPKKQQQTPTPTPSSGINLSGIFAATKAAQIALLNERGPQFPTSFDTGKFTIMAFVKGHWPLVIEYELEKDSLAVIAIAAHTEHGFQAFGQQLRGTGERLTETIMIPDRFGEKPEPGFITVEAFTNPTGEKKHVDFQLYGMGLGVERAASGTIEPPRLKLGPETLDGQLVPVAYSLRSPDILSSLKLLQSGVISGPTFNPGTINASLGGRITYRFQPRDRFGRWAADFRSITKQTKPDGSVIRKTKWVRTDQFDEEIGSGEVSKEWDGKDRKGKISRGEYRLTIRAWWSAVGGGSSVVRLADNNIRVE